MKVSKKGTIKKGKSITEHDSKAIVTANEPGCRILEVIELGREILVIRVSEFKGKRSFDLRRFYETSDGVWAPSQKGFGIGPDLLDAFFDAMDAHRAVVRAEVTK